MYIINFVTKFNSTELKKIFFCVVMNMPFKNRYLNFMLRITNGFELLKSKSRVTYQLHLGGRVLCTSVGGVEYQRSSESP